MGSISTLAMAVHVPNGTIQCLAYANVHDANFDFNAAGDFSAGRNGSLMFIFVSDRRLKLTGRIKDGALEKVKLLKVYIR